MKEGEGRPDIELTARPFEDGLILGRHPDGSMHIIFRGEVTLKVNAPATPPTTPQEQWAFPNLSLRVEEYPYLEPLDDDLFEDAVRAPGEEPEYTARDAAKDLIRPYVERGDEIQWLKEGRMGHYGDKYKASIGGTIRTPFPGGGDRVRGVPPDKIIVDEVEGRRLDKPALYDLEEIYNEIRDEQDPTKHTQKRLF